MDSKERDLRISPSIHPSNTVQAFQSEKEKKTCLFFSSPHSTSFAEDVRRGDFYYYMLDVCGEEP